MPARRRGDELAEVPKRRRKRRKRSPPSPAGALGFLAGVVASVLELAKPKLKPGEVEVIPALRECPTCGWRAGAECRITIRCPRCDTVMPYEGRVVPALEAPGGEVKPDE